MKIPAVESNDFLQFIEWKLERADQLIFEPVTFVPNFRAQKTNDQFHILEPSFPNTVKISRISIDIIGRVPW